MTIYIFKSDLSLAKRTVEEDKKYTACGRGGVNCSQRKRKGTASIVPSFHVNKAGPAALMGSRKPKGPTGRLLVRNEMQIWERNSQYLFPAKATR